MRDVNWRWGAALVLAVGVVYWLHLRRSLGASEAYCALAASQGTYAAVIRTALRYDPGKPPLYQILLHSVVMVFGNGEIALRALSALFSVANIGLVLALGNAMFGPSVAMAAALLWALNPIAITFGAWARMYALLITTALAQLLFLWRLRSKPDAAGAVACGVLGAAMLYSHLASALFLGAEAAMLAGDAWRGGQTRVRWLALLISVVLFLPFAPIALDQLHQLVAGHWLDWIGPAHKLALSAWMLAVLISAAIGLGLVFASGAEGGDYDAVRWCAGLGLLPILVLAAGSITIRPMFEIRYISISFAMLLLAGTQLLASLGARIFRLGTVALATAFVCLLPYYPSQEPWRDFARIVSSGSANEPVFFEAGFVNSNVAETDPDKGFPQGYFRVPFDYYFSGSNPRRVVQPSSPAVIRELIARDARSADGAWLISGKPDTEARAELPARCFSVEQRASSYYASLYHVAPLTGASKCP